MKTLIKKSLVPTCSMLVIAVSGCGSSATNPNADVSGTTTQLAAQTVGGAVSSTNSDTIALNDSERNTMYAKILREITPISDAFASFGVCPTIKDGATQGGTCTLSGDSITLGFQSGGCTYSGGTGPIWVGGTEVTVASPPAGFQCNGTFPQLSLSNQSVTRTYLGNLDASPTSVTGALGQHTVVVDTSAPAATTFESATTASPTSGTIGFDYSIPAGGGYDRSYVSASNHNLNIAVRLVGYSGSAPGGAVQFDHTLSTTDSSGSTTPLNVQLNGSGSNLTQEVNGTLYLQHNLMKMTATAQFDKVVHGVTCCYPVSGTITTSFSGGVNNGLSESMTFSAATCELGTMGQATFTDVNGNVSTKTLDRCF